MSVFRRSSLSLLYSASGLRLSSLRLSSLRLSASRAGVRTLAAHVEDPHAWLEDVLGDAPLAWCRERNAECVAALGEPKTSEGSDYPRILSILDSKEKIASINRIGDGEKAWYNFWQDDVHVQGIWRRTTLASFRESEPEWETVLDLDALPPPTTDTASTWVWHGSTLLDEGAASQWDRALISLSPGGSDADTMREFDLATQSFVAPAEGGFAMPRAAKTSVQYRSRDELLVGTDFEFDGASMTDSGYARVVKSWRRGTPISEAVTVFEGEQADVAASMYCYHDRGQVHEFQQRAVTFYTQKVWYRRLSAERLRSTTADREDAPFRLVPVPEDAEVGTFADVFTVTLRSAWSPPGFAGGSFPAGSLLTCAIEAAMVDDWSTCEALFVPSEVSSLDSVTATRDYLVLKVLEDVRSRLALFKFDDASSTWSKVGDGALTPVGEEVAVASTSRDERDNSLFFYRDGFLVPDTLELVPDCARLAETQSLKAQPAQFDASGLGCAQHFATSLDGTQIPYFVIRREDLPLDGSTPTLLDAYGGFEISMTPGYSATLGAAWLEAGGTKVIANVRGGGEYGPRWHQAALREKRHAAFEDVEAVAADLIARGYTSAPKLGVIGGSNGGLMVGNMLTRPVAAALFGAAVCQVPLLDMKVYSKLLAGASWMAEYGDPDVPADWAFLRNHSPYHLLRHDRLGLPELMADGTLTAPTKDPAWRCPKVLFTTSTRDDRVHPGHARKMVAALQNEADQASASTVLYYENLEGGHGGAADNKQRAHMWALTYTFLKQNLGL